MNFQCFPSRVHISRPQEGGISLHPCVSVAMECIRSFIRPVYLRAFPVHAISNQPRGNVQWIAFIWPPAINAHGEVLTVCAPLATRLFFIEFGKFARITRGSLKFVGEYHGVEHNAEIVSMKFFENFFRVGKYA